MNAIKGLLRNLFPPITVPDAKCDFSERLSSGKSSHQSSFSEKKDEKMASECLRLFNSNDIGQVHSRSIPYYIRRQWLYFKNIYIEPWIAGSRRQTVDEIRADALTSLGRGRRG